MYGFAPTEEQKMLIDAIARYSKGDLRPAARDAEEERTLPASLVEKGWELGFLQASIPEAYGGFGERSAVTGVLAAEELAYGDLAGAIAIMLPATFAVPTLLVGNEDQKKEIIPEVIEGDWAAYSSAFLEPTFDFDPNEMKTTATLAGGDYVLSGVKTFVPFAADAKEIIVYAQLDGRPQGFLVRNGAPGMIISEERLKLLGMNALPLFEVNLEGVHVPKANRLGGDAGHDFTPVLASQRLANAALAVGVARAAFEFARDYAKEREAFGVKIAQKQAIAFMLAEMATEIEASRLLTWEAAWKMDTGKEDYPVAAFLASTGAADMAMTITDRAVQILGGYGYIREFPVELWMRNGRGFSTITGLAIV
jgi:alkylation response protein AidB-like acyl-CoA dehydrogenase